MIYGSKIVAYICINWNTTTIINMNRFKEVTVSVEYSNIAMPSHKHKSQTVESIKIQIYKKTLP